MTLKETMDGIYDKIQDVLEIEAFSQQDEEVKRFLRNSMYEMRKFIDNIEEQKKKEDDNNYY